MIVSNTSYWFKQLKGERPAGGNFEEQWNEERAAWWWEASVGWWNKKSAPSTKQTAHFHRSPQKRAQVKEWGEIRRKWKVGSYFLWYVEMTFLKLFMFKWSFDFLFISMCLSYVF